MQLSDNDFIFSKVLSLTLNLGWYLKTTVSTYTSLPMDFYFFMTIVTISMLFTQ